MKKKLKLRNCRELENNKITKVAKLCKIIYNIKVSNFGYGFSNEDKEIIENIVDNSIMAENQMLEDIFVFAVKYAYKILNEIKV